MDAKTYPEKDEHIDPVCGMTITGKVFREETGASLKDAKEFIESLRI